MLVRLRNAFERLLDWQTCSEDWAFSIQKRNKDTEWLFEKFKNGARIETDFLEFPSNHKVSIELAQDSFVVRPYRVTGLIFSVTMLFRGWAEVQNDAIYVIGKYTPPNYYRRLHAAWNLGVIGLAFTPIPISVLIGFEQNDLRPALFVAPIAQVAMVAGCAFLLASAKVMGALVSFLNSLAGANLQKFLSEMSVSNMAR